jgi:hypothetical protein
MEDVRLLFFLIVSGPALRKFHTCEAGKAVLGAVVGRDTVDTYGVKIVRGGLEDLGNIRMGFDVL